jgi:hypothetical protein
MQVVHKRDQSPGTCFTKEGIHPMDKILRKMRESRRPENKDKLRPFLGLV